MNIKHVLVESLADLQLKGIAVGNGEKGLPQQDITGTYLRLFDV